jgi:two-component system copper resistance phosphate regulon response regulator CusR
MPRSAIIERLWAGDTGISDNAVDALASRLRRRIDGPFGTKLLHTVRGVGYCLAVTDDLRLAC